jgi:pyruvate,water dikinase
MTDPNWEPVMKVAAAIVTNPRRAHLPRRDHRARARHSRGGGLRRGDQAPEGRQQVTVSCAEGDTGNVYEGLIPFEVTSRARGEMPRIPVKITMNVGNPELAFEFAQLPNAGRRPRAAGVHHQQRDRRAPARLPRIPGAARPPEGQARGKGARLRQPEGLLPREDGRGAWPPSRRRSGPSRSSCGLSDFKSNEYRKLLGGERYEPEEENPMLGWRGASRYVAEDFRECFELECAAMKKVRDELGLTNVELMVPFVRTIGEQRSL